jgi:molybdate transport system substrate-binding protein
MRVSWHWAKFKVTVVALVVVMAVVLGCGSLRAADALLVFAPSSLKEVIEKIAVQFERNTGIDMRVSVAASSTLARQVNAGAPADIIISADRQWMDYLQRRGLIVAASRVPLAGNSLVLIAPAADARPLDLSLPLALAERLGDGRLAIADPEHVPAGRYAKAALKSLGHWVSVRPRVVGAENVRVALILVARGEAKLGVVYHSDAKLTAAVSVVARFPASSHQAIVYPAALVTGGAPNAAMFLSAVASPEAAEVFTQMGFVAERNGHVAAQ